MILPSASPISLLLGLGAVVAYAVPALAAARLQAGGARVTLWTAWVLHASALAWSMAVGVPHFGFAPALSITAWLVLTVYGVERQLFPQLQARCTLAALGALAVLLALLFPGQPLNSSASPCLALHLALGIYCYGLFAAAVAHGAIRPLVQEQVRAATATAHGQG